MLTSRVEDAEPHDLKAGEWTLRGVEIKGERGRYIWWHCPACSEPHGVPIAPLKNGWEWDEEAESLTPSIQVSGGCNWHGYITNGEIRTV